jgi:ACR3 family arsenite transporter
MTAAAPVVAEKRLSTLDRFLPVWIALAMVVGLVLGNVFSGLDDALDRVKIDTVSLPIAIGLLVMMYPVLAKVRYAAIGGVLQDRRPFVLTLVLNWLIGPALMFTLAWLMLPDLDDYRTGLVIVGLAPCIAMVIIWIDLANGNNELAAVFVAINALIQIVAFSALGYFYLDTLPGWLGLDTSGIDVSVWEIAKSVLIFLGIPLVLGFATRVIGERVKGREWYENRFAPRVGPFALYGLLFTIVILFALQGDRFGRPAAACVLHRDVGRCFPRCSSSRHGLRPGRLCGLHCSGQQLRARHCGVYRRLRGHLGSGTRRCGGPTHRGSCALGSGVRGALGAQTTVRRDRNRIGLIRTAIGRRGTSRNRNIPNRFVVRVRR